MAYSQKQWDEVRGWYEIGLTLSEIAERTSIKDRGSISRKAKLEGWVKGKNATVVQAEVVARQALFGVEAENATKNTTEVGSINTAVAEQLQSQRFFRSANMLVANTVVAKVKREGQNASFKELGSTAVALGRTQESVLGRSPETVNHQHEHRCGCGEREFGCRGAPDQPDARRWVLGGSKKGNRTWPVKSLCLKSLRRCGRKRKQLGRQNETTTALWFASSSRSKNLPVGSTREPKSCHQKNPLDGGPCDVGVVDQPMRFFRMSSPYSISWIYVPSSAR